MSDTEREAFEAWVTKRWGGDRGELRIRDMAGSERLGEYVNSHVQFARDAWQAAVAAERERRHQWSESAAVAAAHAAGFAGTHWTMGPEELAHLLNMVHARPNDQGNRPA